MKLFPLGCAFFLGACGQLSQYEPVKVNLLKEQETPVRNSSEDDLGLGQVKRASAAGVSTSLQTKAGLEPARLNQAFGSYVRFNAPSTGQDCAGVLAWEPNKTRAGFADLYFYTAVHCFEKVNPLGIATIVPTKKLIQVGTAAKPATRFARPFNLTSAFSAPIVHTKIEMQHDKSGAPTDVIRFSLATILRPLAETTFLPTCDQYTGLRASEEALQAMGWSNKTNSLFVANMQLEDKLLTLPSYISQMFSVSNQVSHLYKLENISTSPGESGGPVFRISGRADVDRVDAYQCVRGIISREVVLPSPMIIPGTMSLTVNSYFSPLNDATGGYVWKELM